jgi:hypothetical protein
VYVAWEDNTPVTGSGGKFEIWMRVSLNYGASFGSAIRITTNTGHSENPSVAASGQYVYVAWEDGTPVSGSGGAAEVWMRVSSNYGASFGSAMRITTNIGYSGVASVSAYGSYVYVAWQDDTPVPGSGTADEIWMRVSSNYGASFGSAMRMSTNTYNSWSPSVAASGNYVYVAWQDDTPVSGSGSNLYPEVWMRASSNYGALFGSAIRITTNTGVSENPSVAAVGSYVYIAWDDRTPVDPFGWYEIWMRFSSNYGASFGSAIRITRNAYTSVWPSVAASGNIYLAWEDDTPVSGSGTAPEIWLRVGS